MAADQLWWEYAERTPFYEDMKRRHVQAMLHKEQKLNLLVTDRLKQLVGDADTKEDLLAAEDLLFRILELEFSAIDLLDKK